MISFQIMPIKCAVYMWMSLIKDGNKDRIMYTIFNMHVNVNVRVYGEGAA